MAQKGKTAPRQTLEIDTGHVAFRPPGEGRVRTSVTPWVSVWLWTIVVVGALVALRCR